MILSPADQAGQAMWPFSKPADKLNHMDFVGDGDDVDAIVETEKAFGIVIADADAEVVRTVYDLFKLVWAKLPESRKGTEFAELEVWHQLCHRLRGINGFDGPIDLETTFFAEHAKPRQHHG